MPELQPAIAKEVAELPLKTAIGEHPPDPLAIDSIKEPLISCVDYTDKYRQHLAIKYL